MRWVWSLVVSSLCDHCQSFVSIIINLSLKWSLPVFVWVIVDCLLFGLSLTVYCLNRHWQFIVLNIIDCLLFEWSLSVYCFSYNWMSIVWDIIGSLLFELSLNVYCLSDHWQFIAWVTIEYGLSCYLLSIAYVVIDRIWFD